MTDEEKKALLAKLANETKIDPALLAIVGGETEEEITTNAKAMAAGFASVTKPLSEKIAALETAGKEKPKSKEGEFDGEILGTQLDKLEKKYGEEAVGDYLRKRVGVDKLEGRIGEMELTGARARLALEHGLTPEQAAAVPGSTVEDLQANVEFAKGMAGAKGTGNGKTETKPAGETGGTGVVGRQIGGGKTTVPTVEQAEVDFLNTPPTT